MSSSDQRSINERRASFRCPANGPRRAGRLRIGKRELAVEVLDESAGGYSIVCEQELDCEVGQSLLVRIESNWSKVRIMNLQQEDGHTRLGLLRLKDLEASEVDSHARVKLSIDGLAQLARALSPMGRVVAGVVVLLVGGALVGAGVMVALERSARMADVVKHHDPGNIEEMMFPQAPPLPQTKTGDEEPGPLKRKEKTPKGPAPMGPAGEQTIPRAEVQAAGPSSSAQAGSEITASDDVVRHSHPGLMLKPEIVKLLALNHGQINQLRRLFEETRSSTAAALASDAELALEVGKRTLSVLTPAQRETVTRMLSNARSTGSPPGK